MQQDRRFAQIDSRQSHHIRKFEAIFGTKETRSASIGKQFVDKTFLQAD